MFYAPLEILILLSLAREYQFEDRRKVCPPIGYFQRLYDVRFMEFCADSQQIEFDGICLEAYTP